MLGIIVSPTYIYYHFAVYAKVNFEGGFVQFKTLELRQFKLRYSRQRSSVIALVLVNLLLVVISYSSSCLASSVFGQGTWETTLQPRDLDGNPATVEAFYDSLLNITWLADANYAQTIGHSPSGKMNWSDAQAWVENLTVYGISGWRLPTATPINGNSYNYNFSNNASTDNGYANSAGWIDAQGHPVSEMGHMYYVTLGNLGYCAPYTNASCNVPAGWGLSNSGPFPNIQARSSQT